MIIRLVRAPHRTFAIDVKAQRKMRGGDRKSNRQRAALIAPTLAELGITVDQSARWQQLEHCQSLKCLATNVKAASVRLSTRCRGA
jgi:hypothetical protein